MRLGVIKEPRGFLKIIQFIFVIAAFGTITDYEYDFDLSVPCNNTTADTAKSQFSEDYEDGAVDEVLELQFLAKIKYNYQLNKLDLTAKSCPLNVDKETKLVLNGNFKSESEFFVFTGVTAMLFSLFAIVFYVICDLSYMNIGLYSVIDLVIHGIFTIFWFAGSSAWANAVVRMKDYTSRTGIREANILLLKGDFDYKQDSLVPLDMSIVLGFVNTFLYASNLWFVYKETPFFSTNPYPPME